MEEHWWFEVVFLLIFPKPCALFDNRFFFIYELTVPHLFCFNTITHGHGRMFAKAASVFVSKAFPHVVCA